MMVKFIHNILLLLIAVVLVACNGGGGGSGSGGGDNTRSGYFIDSAVSGLRYETSSGISGVTDASGKFNYAPGDTVTFYIGDIQVGQATGATLLTPVSLVPGATDETDTTVTNIARFLQSLDADSDPSNGITIDSAVATEAAGESLDFSAVNFDAAASLLVENLRDAVYGTGDTGTLVTVATAQAHLLGSLLCELSGSFQGTWVQTVGAQPNSGTWSFSVDDSGNITGTALNDSGGATSLSGSVSSDGTAAVGSSADGTAFSGTIGLDGSVSGTWSNTYYGTSGTYSGSLVPGSAASCGGTAGPSIGTLSISGTDTSVIGTLFTPNTLSADDAYTVRWRTVVDGGGGAGVITHSILVLLDADRLPISFTYSRVIGADEYHYQIVCATDGCGSIANDDVAQTVTFTNTVFPAYTALGLASGPVTMNGTLSYAGLNAP